MFGQRGLRLLGTANALNDVLLPQVPRSPSGISDIHPDVLMYSSDLVQIAVSSVAGSCKFAAEYGTDIPCK